MATPQSPLPIDQTLMDNRGKSGKNPGGVSRAKPFFGGEGGLEVGGELFDVFKAIKKIRIAFKKHYIYGL